MNGVLGLVLLLAVVALGGGGYEPWATLVLEIGAVLAFVLLVFVRLWPSNGIRARQHAAWRRMPFHVRHPTLGSWFRFGRTPVADVEILLPGEREEAPVGLDVGRNVYVLGIPLKRTGLALPVALVSGWILLSSIPVDEPLLELVSPEAARIWTDAAALSEPETPSRSVPWSVAPFVTLRSLWVWVGVVALFFVTMVLARRPSSVASLSLLFLLLGAGFGAFGMAQWLSGVQSLLGQESKALRAAASFGNPNHYAAFQAMLLSISIGWLAFFRERATSGARGAYRARDASRALGLGVIAGMGVLMLALGLFMSLSRSGVTFALAGCATWVLLTREAGDRRPVWALGLAAVGLVVWIGIGPLLGRFENLQEQWVREQGRTTVWQDTLPALGDYWLTGSGLGTFRYVGSAYRSFGGQIYYSWAHNDYLQLAVEMGAPGMLLLLWLGWVTVRAARRVRSDVRGDAAMTSLHAGYLGALVAVALHSVTDFSLHLPANLALLAMVVAVVVGLDGADSDTSRALPPRR